LYNQLSHISEAQHHDCSGTDKLIKIITNYGLEKTLGISRLHRHFILKENEKVIWKFEKDFSTSRVAITG
jgi:hypothetical protein